MAQFSYKARRKSGEVVQGVLEVADRTAALTQIERLGLFPVAVEAAKGAAVVQTEGGPREGAASRGGFSPPLRAVFYFYGTNPRPGTWPFPPQVCKHPPFGR